MRSWYLEIRRSNQLKISSPVALARASELPPAALGRGRATTAGLPPNEGREVVAAEDPVEEEPVEEGPEGPTAGANGGAASAETGGTTTEAVEVAQAFLVHFT